MPVKKLPPELVSRLRKVAKQIDRKLGRMENIDYKKDMYNASRRDSRETGRRVRRMNVSKIFPQVKGVVIKRTHEYSPKETLKILRRIVREHDKRFKPKNYVLKEPKAYVIGSGLLAMSFANFPNIYEIFFEGTQRPSSRRGIEFFERMQKKHGITMEQFKTAASEFEGNLNKLYLDKPAPEQSEDAISFYLSFRRNTLVLGFKDGKFVFMPLLDIW